MKIQWHGEKSGKSTFYSKTLNWAKLQKKLNWCLFLWKEFTFADESFIVNKNSLYYMCENKNTKIVIVTAIVFVQ